MTKTETAQLSYQELTKAPNLLYMAVMEYMKHLVKTHNEGENRAITQKPDQLKSWIEITIAELLRMVPEMQNELKVSALPAHPATPRRRYVGLVWDSKDRTVLLCQITYVMQEGGEYEG